MISAQKYIQIVFLKNIVINVQNKFKIFQIEDQTFNFRRKKKKKKCIFQFGYKDIMIYLFGS